MYWVCYRIEGLLHLRGWWAASEPLQGLAEECRARDAHVHVAQVAQDDQSAPRYLIWMRGEAQGTGNPMHLLSHTLEILDPGSSMRRQVVALVIDRSFAPGLRMRCKTLNQRRPVTLICPVMPCIIMSFLREDQSAACGMVL